MKQNKLGHSNLYVSEIGFGCMSLKGDQISNEKMIHEAISKGINFFDTADLYEKGMNEESVGKALKDKRKDVILATKGGNEWGEGIDGWRWNPTKGYLKTAVKKSLQRLGTDYIDLYQLHGGTMDDPIEETIEAFEELVQEGNIRYYGISSIRPNVIKTYLEKSNISSIMMQYSLLDRRPEEWLDLIEKHNVSVIARGPVAKGFLANNFERKLSSDGYLQYAEDELKSTLDQLIKEAEKNNLSLQQMALRYTIDHPVVATAIPGASKLDQLLENVSAANVSPLSEEKRKYLQSLTKEWEYKQHRE
ncbi:aldo/keto reductase [Evansella sp. AB-P1]|uniref:aldo/keto reductase n=1 Tax=Evansella sp. AB-P1 TaxID=3037653 RepID=UPI00241EA179|nr:aldo/keto reductase [Evansella sp. AB-P1]MDG5787690.1 aldo/keto reductase [Evansella sp. AB-P1]